MHYFIANPKAGRGLGQKVMQDLKAYLSKKGLPHDIAYTEYPGHAIELASQAKGKGHEKIVAVGGDGTVLEVSTGIMNQEHGRCTLGIIPAGTGNDFRKSIGIPKNHVEAMDAILKNEKKDVDIALVNGRYYLNVAGLGFDVEVIRKTESTKKFGLRGLAAYYAGVLLATLTYKFQKAVITTDDGREIRREVLMVSVANGQYQGGGMHVAPLAKVDDGLLDVCVICRLPRLKIISLLPTYVKGEHLKWGYVEYFKCRSVRVESGGEPALLNMDGEIIGHTPAEFSLAKKPLSIFV